jgi:sortase B
MRRKVRLILLVLLGLVFAASAARLVYQLFQYQAAETAYDQAETLANVPDLASVSVPESADTETPDPYAEAIRDIDLDALRAVNGDVVGWIAIPNTEISYPLVQGTDDQYYLKHTWDRSASVVGSIFLDGFQHHRLRPPDEQRLHVCLPEVFQGPKLLAGAPQRVHF